jgi:type IV secretion system protein VirB6
MLTPSLLAEVTLFVTIDKDIQRQLDAIVIPAVNNLIGALQTTALLGGTLYILIVGLTIVLGADSTPFYTFIKTSAKIAFVAALSLSSEGYLGGVMGALRGLESGLLQVFGFFPNSSGPAGGLPFQLDRMLDLGFDKFASCYEHANREGLLSPGAALAWITAGLIFGLSTAALAIFGGAITILVQFALAILFALGPLFVLGLMFPQTSGFFDKWLAEVLSFILQNVVVAIVLSFAMSIFLKFIATAELEKGAAMNPFTAALQIFVVALVLVYFLWKSGPMVAGLSGGMGSSVIDAVSAYQTGKAVSKGAVAGAKAAGGAVSKVAGGAKKAAGGVSKLASRLAAFGKSSSLGASSGGSAGSSGGSDKSSAAPSSPSSSSAAKSAVASGPATSPTSAGGGSRSGSFKERKAAKLGARLLRSNGISNFGAVSAPKPRASVPSASSAPKPSTKPENPNNSSAAPTSDKPKETR